MPSPPVDGQGNYGSIDGDPPAAMRYTEARLQALADDLQADLDKDTVDFTPNYDETTEEPTVLPAPFPNLLVNGASGIAVGMATNIPPHNLREIIDGCIWLIENPHLRGGAIASGGVAPEGASPGGPAPGDIGSGDGTPGEGAADDAVAPTDVAEDPGPAD